MQLKSSILSSLILPGGPGFRRPGPAAVALGPAAAAAAMLLLLLLLLGRRKLQRYSWPARLHGRCISIEMVQTQLFPFPFHLGPTDNDKDGGDRLL